MARGEVVKRALWLALLILLATEILPPVWRATVAEGLVATGEVERR